MRIAQVAPLYESVPPKFYGGTERVVSFLTEELVRQGHDVTLFASGDSVTQANLVPISPKSLRLGHQHIDQLAWHVLMCEKVFQTADDFDMIHFHIDYLHFPLSRRMKTPQITTMHGRLDIPDILPLHREFSDMPLVSISLNQRMPLPSSRWAGNVYHGLPLDLLQFHESKGNYLAFLGRISPEKRVDRAIEIAIACGVNLKIAAKVDKNDRDYFETDIKPLFQHPLIEYIGEINDREKSDFLGNAMALLFPIDWPEPFGLVMIEALACGTPVLAFQRGSAPEVIEHGKTGFIVSSVAEAVACIKNIDQINRRVCRGTFEERFSVARMTYDYLNIYKKVSDENT